MKTKTLLISLSVIGFLSVLLTSCSNEEDMGIGVSSGENTPDGYISSNSVLDSIPFPQNDTITRYNIPKD